MVKNLPGKRHRFNPWVGKIPWSRKWQPIPIFMPRKFHGQKSLAGYSPWGCKESNMTEHTHTLRNGVFPTTSINKDVRAIRDSGPPNVNF